MRQHLHNKIGNIVGEHKRALYDSLQTGTDVETAVDAFINKVSVELRDAVASDPEHDDDEPATNNPTPDAYPSLDEQIEIWAKRAITAGETSQQLAVISILATISESDDPEAMANLAMYAAFKCADSLHDEAIKCVVEAGKEDYAVAVTKAHERRKGSEQ